MIHLVLLACTVILAMLAVEFKNLNRAILAFSAMSISLAVIFYMAGAYILSIFQITVFGGAVTVLMLAALHVGGESG